MKNKIIHFICYCWLLIPCFSIAQSVHFYLDTGCEQCNINEEGIQNYWIITSETYAANLDEYEENQVWEDFKRQLQENFTEAAPLLHQVTFRKLADQESIATSRERKIAKMRGTGYKIIEIDYDFKAPIKHTAIEGYLRTIEAHGFKGSILLAEKDQILHEGYYGLAKASPPIQFNRQTLFPIASMTKAVTATAILLLEEQGKLKLTDALPSIFESVPTDKQSVTIHHLLSHTSGMWREYLSQNRNYSYEEVLQTILEKPLAFEVGKKFNYSNTAYDLLALIIEKVSGQSYEEFIEEQIFEKADLKNACFLHSDYNSNYLPDGFDEWGNFPFPRNTYKKYARLGAGGVVMNMADTWKWFSALKNGQIISPNSFDKMKAVYAKTEGDKDYGYGLFINPSEQEIWLEGDYEGFHANIKWLPKEDQTIIVFSNQDLYRHGVQRKRIASNIEQLFKEESIELPSILINLHPRDLSTFCGIFESSEGQQLSIRLENRTLKLFANDQQLINNIIPINQKRIAQVDAWNRHTQELLEFLVAKDFDSFSTLLKAKNPTFFANKLKAEIAEFEKQYGTLTRGELKGTLPFPWKSPNYQTIVFLYFGEKMIDLSFVWQENGLYETLSDFEMEATLIRHLVPTSLTTTTVYDLITEKEILFNFSKNHEVLKVGDLTFFKIDEQLDK